MKSEVAILAYGSLIDDSRQEIQAAMIGMRDCTTPFKIEYARQSRTRKGAPTLISVESGGGQVSAKLLLLNVTSDEAANRLWRRETGRKGNYPAKPNPGVDDVVVNRLDNFEGVSEVLYTQIGGNIEPLTAERLAELAISSARELYDGRDGITYLINAKKNGILTPLSESYEREIKRRLQVYSLEEAVLKARAES